MIGCMAGRQEWWTQNAGLLETGLKVKMQLLLLEKLFMKINAYKNLKGETNTRQTHSKKRVANINDMTESKGKDRAEIHSGVIRE